MIDSSIALGVKPFQIESQANNLANILKLQELQQGGQLNALKLQEAQRGIEQQNNLRSILSGIAPNEDAASVASKLMRGGMLKEAGEYQKQMNEAGMNASKKREHDLNSAQKANEMAGSVFGAIKANPTPEMVQSGLSYLNSKGILPEKEMQLFADQYSKATTPDMIAELAGLHHRSAVPAKDQAPKIETKDTGLHTQTLSTDPFTGKTAITNSIQNTQSPNNAATVAASLANAAATRSVAQATRDAANVHRDQNTEMKLADDYRAQSKEFGQATSAFKQINATLDSATTSPAATLAAATKFMKILDPGSVVRESELGMALQASGVIDRATNYINVLQRGKVLTPAQAADFKNISSQMYSAAQQVQQAIDTDYKTKAKTYNLRPEMVLQDLGQNTPSPTKANAAKVPTDINLLLQKYGGK